MNTSKDYGKLVALVLGKKMPMKTQLTVTSLDTYLKNYDLKLVDLS